MILSILSGQLPGKILSILLRLHLRLLGQKTHSYWARASTGRGRINLWGVNRSSHVMFFMRPRPHSRGQLVIQLSIAIVPQQMIYYSHSWYLWFYGHSFSEYILCWLFLDSCSRCSTGFCNAPFDPAWELTGMTLVSSTMPLRSALAYDISHCFSHGSSRWPVFVVSGGLQQIGEQSRIYGGCVCDLLAVHVSRWDFGYGIWLVNRTWMPSLVCCCPPGLVHDIEFYSSDDKRQRLRMYYWPFFVDFMFH